MIVAFAGLLGTKLLVGRRFSMAVAADLSGVFQRAIATGIITGECFEI